MNRLLSFAAAAEALTGAALIVVPSIVGLLLLGAEFSGVTVAVARVAGIALVALGVACYPGGAATRKLCGMLTYSLLVTLYLIFLGFAGEWVGILLWLAAAIHAALTIFLATAWLRNMKAEKRNDRST
jgi:membrane protein implicated in regulation of membrane protease activity